MNNNDISLVDKVVYSFQEEAKVLPYIDYDELVSSSILKPKGTKFLVLRSDLLPPMLRKFCVIKLLKNNGADMILSKPTKSYLKLLERFI